MLNLRSWEIEKQLSMKMILLLLHHVHYEPLLDKMKAKMVKKIKPKITHLLSPPSLQAKVPTKQNEKPTTKELKRCGFLNIHPHIYRHLANVQNALTYMKHTNQIPPMSKIVQLFISTSNKPDAFMISLFPDRNSVMVPPQIFRLDIIWPHQTCPGVWDQIGREPSCMHTLPAHDSPLVLRPKRSRPLAHLWLTLNFEVKPSCRLHMTWLTYVGACLATPRTLTPPSLSHPFSGHLLDSPPFRLTRSTLSIIVYSCSSLHNVGDP